MPKTNEYSGNLWAQRISAAQRYHKRWKNKYRCDQLEKYYKGDQWKGKKDFFSINYNPYTLNLFYSTIKLKMAGNLFQRPSFTISPRAANSNDNLDFAMQSAATKQDVLNTIVQNPNMFFAKHIKRAYIDSFFRFGVIEVGYANDWRNPLKQEPLTKSYLDPNVEVGSSKDRVIEDTPVGINERFYIKRIKPARFLVSVSDAEDLEDHDWYGYLEYYYTRTLKNTDSIKYPESTDFTPQYASDFTGYVDGSDRAVSGVPNELSGYLSSGEITPVWRVWNNVERKQFLLRDGDFAELWNSPFERGPIVDFRWDEELSGFYPIPPAYQWLSPQDEINESREQVRSFRRRFTRKFQYVDQMVDELEAEKFTSGPDGVLIKVKQQNAITPIDNPDIGHTADEALIQAKDDFYTITGTDAQAPQNSDRQTATGAKLLAGKAAIRESADQLDFNNFVVLVGREVLCQAQEKLVEGLWVKYTSAPQEGILQDMQMNPTYKWIKAEDLRDGYDFDIDVDVINQTPQAMQVEQQSFVSFLAIVQQYPATAMSPILIRECARVSGYRNEKVIQQYQQAAALSMAMKAAAAGGQVPGNPNNAAVAQTSQMQTPNIQETANQLQNQVQ
jgi:hypothetical protein